MRFVSRLVLLVSLFPCLLAAKNLLPNGDFAHGLEHWRVFGKVPPVVVPHDRDERQVAEINGASGIEARINKLPARVLRITGWVKWQDVVRGERSWHRGAVILEMFDAEKRGVGHREIFMAEGSGDWTRFDREVALPDAVASVALQLKGWRTRSGTLWFSDIAITPVDGKASVANLLTNGGFELEAGGQPLFWSHPDGVDWDGFAYNPSLIADAGNAVEWTAEDPRSGERSLRFSAPATAVSDPIPVEAGVYHAAAWMKTKDVITGRRDWCTARVQVVFFNEDGRKLLLVDLAYATGTTPWTAYSRQIVAPTGSKEARIYLRLFESAAGSVWFDDLEFGKQQTAPAEKVVRERAKLRVDVSKARGEFPYRLEGLASHYMHAFGSNVWKPEIAAIAARRMGVRSIRFQEAGGSMVDARRLPDGEMEYDFSRVVKTLRQVLDLGLTPMLVLESTPEALASAPRTQWTNRFPPRDYAEWENYIFRYVSCLRDTFGAEEVLRWEFETWNEPEAKRYFQGTPDELLKIHRHTVAAARRALPGIRIGSPGFTGAGSGLKTFLEGLGKDANGGSLSEETTPAFVAWHLYSTGTGIPSLLSTRLNLERSREIIEAHPWARTLPRYITEWNSASGGGNPYRGKPYNAAYMLTVLRMMKDAGIDRAYVFQDSEDPRYSPNTEDGYYRGLGLLSPYGLIRPATRAFELLHLMQGERLQATSGGRPVEVLASSNEAGHWVTFWNYLEDPHEAFTTKVSLEIRGLPPSSTVSAVMRIIDHRSDPWPVWSAWGRPDLAYNRELWRKLDAETGLDAGREVVLLRSDENGVARYEREMPVFTVVSLQIPRE